MDCPLYHYSGIFVSCAFVFFFKQKTAYEMRISDWSSDVCSSDLTGLELLGRGLLVLQRGLERLDVRGDLGLDVVGDLVAVVGQELLGGVDETVGLVARLDGFLALAFLVGVLLGLFDHPVDVVDLKSVICVKRRSVLVDFGVLSTFY